MEQIIIRKMKENDFEQVHKLVEQVHVLHLNERKDIYKSQDPLNYEDFIKLLHNSNNICYVAEMNSVIVGEVFSTVKEIKEEEIFKQRRILFIEDICVDRQYNRQGIGAMLFDKMVQYAEKKEINSIELNVWSFNKKAIEFYKKMGMKSKNIRYEYIIKDNKRINI